MNEGIQYLELGDFLIIAEELLGPDRSVRIDLASSALAAPAASFEGIEFYPEFEQKAAVLCWHLVKDHPLVDGNKRVAFLCLVEFVERNGYSWSPPPGDEPEGEETVAIIYGAADGTVDVPQLASWICDRLTRMGE